MKSLVLEETIILLLSPSAFQGCTWVFSYCYDLEKSSQVSFIYIAQCHKSQFPSGGEKLFKYIQDCLQQNQNQTYKNTYY